MESDRKEGGRVPPQNIDAEKSLLGATLLLEDNIALALEEVTAEDFYVPAHGIIFQAMHNLYNTHQKIDLLTLKNALTRSKQLKEVGGASFLATLTQHVPTASHADAYAKIVADTAARRRMIQSATEILNMAFDDVDTVDNLIDKGGHLLYSAAGRTSKADDIAWLPELLDQSFNQIERMYKNKDSLTGLKTGFRDLDNKTAGLHGSDLVILAARPAMGKTTFATNLAYNVSTINKKGVLIFSLEMAKEQIVLRMIADAAGVDGFSLRTGRLSEDDFLRVSEAMGEMAEANIGIIDSTGMNPTQMRTKARKAVHDNNVGMVVIDYLQLMEGSAVGKMNGRVQEVSEISRELKKMARELNVPVIALSQLNRSVETRDSKIPMLADLRESGSIEQDADIVMFLHRESYYNKDTERQNITDLVIAKHRNGPVGSIELYFDPEHLRFMSLDKQHE
ncbi:replicative DNA helicase [Candidatus Saccharibacteria bacterium]|nr:replicative DNA helicase [Candidatus Saccharibacteria bacterium]